MSLAELEQGQRSKVTFRSSGFGVETETVAHSLCHHRFRMGTNAPGLFPVLFQGAPLGGREPPEDMLLLRRSPLAPPDRGFPCENEGLPLSLPGA